MSVRRSSKIRKAIAASAIAAPLVVAGTPPPAGGHHDRPDRFPDDVNPLDVWTDQSTFTVDVSDATAGVAWGNVIVSGPAEIQALNVNATNWDDVRVTQMVPPDPTDAGWYSCVTAVGSPMTACAQSVIRLNPVNRPLGDWKRLGCHELGHAIGLDHWSPPSAGWTCMELSLGASPAAGLVATATPQTGGHSDYEAVAAAANG